MIRFIGIGDNVVDKYAHQGIYYPGGCSVNASIYAKKLGHESAYLGLLAKDKEARVVMAGLDYFGVDYSHCPFTEDGETGICRAEFNGNDRIIIDENDLGACKATPLQLSEEDLSYIATFDVAHSSYYAFMVDQLWKIKSIGIPLVYDFTEWFDEKTVDAVCPNITVALFSCGEMEMDEIEALLKKAYGFGLELAIATMGMRGAVVYDGKEFYSMPPFKAATQVLDTMGAGDSYITGFITTYYDGLKKYKTLTENHPESFSGTEGEKDFKKNLIHYAMTVGNLMAVHTCFNYGGNGHGVKIDEAR